MIRTYCTVNTMKNRIKAFSLAKTSEGAFILLIYILQMTLDGYSFYSCNLKFSTAKSFKTTLSQICKFSIRRADCSFSKEKEMCTVVVTDIPDKKQPRMLNLLYLNVSLMRSFIPEEMEYPELGTLAH